ncbi:zeta toxin family protein [Emticicia agri]|uniref:Zeta toxin domain-containing protein n=1 Tax=Emticicia agri TaxID=2492393 RepID=A0A4Q5LVY8_9BACT|nr:zeta toxin family protein [Emticicia agri]RYU93643.1 hypothetical protein EWM59_21155 [Emticicia agri]
MIRPLTDNLLVTEFLEGILGEDSDIIKSKTVSKISAAELTIKGFDLDNNTLNSRKYRDPNFSTDRDRRKLRDQIVEELSNMKRLSDDNDIVLGEGGALPLTTVKKESQAYIVTGLPASGKSGIANKIADSFGAALLDSDYAKRKLPEFEDFNAGASIIHKESGAIIFGSATFNSTSFETLLDKFSVDNTNIVVPKIGDSVEELLSLKKKLNEFGYEVHLTLVSLDRKKATERAIKRFESTGRYVPLSRIYDVYANEPILSYYRIKTFHEHEFKSVGKISNDVEVGMPPRFIACNNISNPAYLYK